LTSGRGEAAGVEMGDRAVGVSTTGLGIAEGVGVGFASGITTGLDWGDGDGLGVVA